LSSQELKEEFLLLIEKNQGIIYKVSRMYCDKESCRQDLFQDILVQLWQSYPGFNKKSKFSTWMYRVALNTAIAQFRKDKRNDQEPVSEFSAEIMEEDNYKEKEERIDLVNRAISKLNKAEKAIIILFMDDYPYEEIAEIAGISVTNVGVKIHRIKSKLQKIIKELENGI